MTLRLKALALAAVLAGANQAHANTFTISLSGDTSQFAEQMSNSGGLHFDDFSLTLSGLDSSNAITVSKGDTVDSTVNLNAIYTIPASAKDTYILHYLTSSTFPSENSGVDGTFTFFDLGVPVASFGYSSTTSSQLSSFAVLFPPNNGAIAFDSFTNDFSINTLATPATLDGSSFEYDLVSNAPEPAAWALMLVGFGLVGALTRRRAAGAAA